MSMKVMTQIWDATDVSGSELLVLLALADHANDNGICWPSLPRIAKRARLSERQTQRVIQKLVVDGHIQILTKGDGRGHSTVYQVCEKGDIAMSTLEDKKGDNMTSLKGDNMSTFGEERVTSRTQRVTSETQKGDIAMSTESIKEPIRESTKKVKEKESNGAAAPAAPVAPKPSDHLANKAYRDLHERYPSKAQMKIISERDPPIGDWVRAIRAWATCGYKPTNVEGMLEWAFNPRLITERTSRNGANNGTNRERPATHDEPEYDPAIQRQFDEHVARRKAEGSLYYR